MSKYFYCFNPLGHFCNTRHESIESAEKHSFKNKVGVKKLEEGEFTVVKSRVFYITGGFRTFDSQREAEDHQIQDPQGRSLIPYQKGKLPMTDKEKIQKAIQQFPATFKLRGHQGVFRISENASYLSGDKIQLYTQVQRGTDWLDFAKGTPDELQREVVKIK